MCVFVWEGAGHPIQAAISHPTPNSQNRTFWGRGGGFGDILVVLKFMYIITSVHRAILKLYCKIYLPEKLHLFSNPITKINGYLHSVSRCPLVLATVVAMKIYYSGFSYMYMYLTSWGNFFPCTYLHVCSAGYTCTCKYNVMLCNIVVLWCACTWLIQLGGVTCTSMRTYGVYACVSFDYASKNICWYYVASVFWKPLTSHSLTVHALWLYIPSLSLCVCVCVCVWVWV